MIGRRPRRLSPEELSLWRKVAETAERLPGATPVEPEVPSPPPPVAPPPAPAAKPQAAAAARAPRPASTPPSPPALIAMDRKTRHRVARGALPLDGRLDLHGLTQQVAHERLYGFLASVQSRGGRLVLVITGKGGPSGDDYLTERGVLRRSVPHWLASELFRPLVIGFDEAARSHGGAGAIYVRLRRRQG